MIAQGDACSERAQSGGGLVAGVRRRRVGSGLCQAGCATNLETSLSSSGRTLESMRIASVWCGAADYSQMRKVARSWYTVSGARQSCGNRASACGVCGRLGSTGQGETLDAGGFAGGTTSMRRPNGQWTVMVYARAVIFTAVGACLWDAQVGFDDHVCCESMSLVR